MADIKFDVHYEQPPEKIWRAITDSETLAKWMMPNDFKPELGHEFQFRAKPMGGWDGIARLARCSRSMRRESSSIPSRAT